MLAAVSVDCFAEFFYATISITPRRHINFPVTACDKSGVAVACKSGWRGRGGLALHLGKMKATSLQPDMQTKLRARLHSWLREAQDRMPVRDGSRHTMCASRCPCNMRTENWVTIAHTRQGRAYGAWGCWSTLQLLQSTGPGGIVLRYTGRGSRPV
jgi:hypothetical protein